MGYMVDFIKNSNRFKCKDIDSYHEDEIKKIMRKCFRYAQDKAKDQFRDYLIQRNRNVKAEEIAKRRMEDTLQEEQNQDDLDNVSINSEEQDFLDNVSWDTDSDEDDLCYDD